MSTQRIILGPPGTGKTTYLINQVKESLGMGVPAHSIGYVAFTTKAANEAKFRAAHALGLSFRELPYFRTIHSLAYQQLGLSKSQVMSREHFVKLGDMLNLKITCYINPDEGSFSGFEEGDRLVFAENLSRVRCISLRDQWEDMIHDPISWVKLEQYQQTLEKYKETKYLIDFTDMLQMFVDKGVAPELDLLVVDEAQDLSELQWRVIDKLKENAKAVIIAGDDDQAIFQWAGASVDRLLDIEGDKKVLNYSYRIPSSVHEVAQKVVKRITQRNTKAFKPREEEGSVKWYMGLQNVDMSEGEWLVLARNNYLLKPIQEACEMQGFNYSTKKFSGVSPNLAEAIGLWGHMQKGKIKLVDRELNLLESYARAKTIQMRPPILWHEAFTKVSLKQRLRVQSMIAKGENLTKPRIHLSTIHGAKGGEADNVLLILDVSWRTYKNMLRNPDEENRVLYVAITRAKERLHLLYPTGQHKYQL